ncbi:uncharacterized protein [Vulpes vulpes]|uniref:Collagen alpha-1(I) chain-like n=1 Tax=Vulpes vulpes TaxID=9627 RepID=A0ABM4XTT4_VULVU
MRGRLRKGGARTRTQWALNKCAFSPFPRLPAPSPSQPQPRPRPPTGSPAPGPALPGWGRRPPWPGIRGPLTCGSSGEPRAPFFGHQLGPAQPACPARLRLLAGSGPGPGLPGRPHGPKSEAPGPRQLKGQSGAEAEGFCAPSGSAGGRGAPALRGSRAGAPTHTTERLRARPQPWTAGWAGSVPRRCTGSGRGSGVRATAPGSVPAQSPRLGGRGGAGQGRAPAGTLAARRGSLPSSDSARSAQRGGLRRGGGLRSSGPRLHFLLFPRSPAARSAPRGRRRRRRRRCHPRCPPPPELQPLPEPSPAEAAPPSARAPAPRGRGRGAESAEAPPRPGRGRARPEPRLPPRAPGRRGQWEGEERAALGGPGALPGRTMGGADHSSAFPAGRRVVSFRKTKSKAAGPSEKPA